MSLLLVAERGVDKRRMRIVTCIIPHDGGVRGVESPPPLQLQMFNIVTTMHCQIARAIATGYTYTAME